MCIHNAFTRRCLFLLVTVLATSCLLQAESPKEKPKPDIKITTIKEALRLHEHPEEFVDKIVELSSDITWFDSDDLIKNKESDGYLFCYYCSTDFKAKDRLGNRIAMLPNELNYWCETDAALVIREKLPPEMVRDSYVYNRVTFTFKIKTKEITETVTRKYHMAELVWLEPKKK